jgi:hypothetical protein
MVLQLTVMIAETVIQTMAGWPFLYGTIYSAPVQLQTLLHAVAVHI